MVAAAMKHEAVARGEEAVAVCIYCAPVRAVSEMEKRKTRRAFEGADEDGGSVWVESERGRGGRQGPGRTDRAGVVTRAREAATSCAVVETGERMR